MLDSEAPTQPPQDGAAVVVVQDADPAADREAIAAAIERADYVAAFREALRGLTDFDWLGLLIDLGILAIAIAAGWIVYRVLRAITLRFARRFGDFAADTVANHAMAPLRLLLPLLGVMLVSSLFNTLSGTFVRHAVGIGSIVAFAWLLATVVIVTERVVLRRHRIDVANNLEARRLHTQFKVLRQAIVILIVIVAAAAVLMTFDAVRQVGATLLASAGLAGLAIGLAARPVLENLIAGIQIAMTQPIRLDDVVIVNNEWGRIEEITSTYVVVRIWDQRRLIVPFSKFISEPFQNWTRTSSEILGTVFLYVGYNAPMQEMREEFGRVLRESGKWDGRVEVIHVTECKQDHIEVRLLMSAVDAGTAFDLRAFVRERMIRWLATRHPEALPRVRVEMRDKLEAERLAAEPAVRLEAIQGAAEAPATEAETAAAEQRAEEITAATPPEPDPEPAAGGGARHP